MPNPIKAFFDKKKSEAKFKLAGKGQKLGDASAAEQSAAAKRDAAMAKVQHQRQIAASAAHSRSGNVTAAQQQAAEAAMAR